MHESLRKQTCWKEWLESDPKNTKEHDSGPTHTRAVLGLSIPRRAPVIIYMDQHSLWKAGGNTKIETVWYVFYKSIHDTEEEWVQRGHSKHTLSKARCSDLGVPDLLCFFMKNRLALLVLLCVVKINTGNSNPKRSSEVRRCEAWPYGLRKFDNSNHLEFSVFENKLLSCESISVLTISENSKFTPKEWKVTDKWQSWIWTSWEVGPQWKSELPMRCPRFQHQSAQSLMLNDDSPGSLSTQGQGDERSVVCICLTVFDNSSLTTQHASAHRKSKMLLTCTLQKSGYILEKTHKWPKLILFELSRNDKKNCPRNSCHSTKRFL